MATDSIMLSESHSRNQVLWRFYSWCEPAITFGYSQNWDWVREQTGPFEGARIRRITGGGIVDHRHDLTYALAIPASHGIHRMPAGDIYKALHQGIADILNALGVRAELAPCQGPCDDNDSTASGVCFQSPEPYDVIQPGSGAKIAGAAMKRNRQGILVQGSISRMGAALPCEQQFIDQFGEFLEKWLETGKTGLAESLPAESVERETLRFSSPEWNHRR